MLKNGCVMVLLVRDRRKDCFVYCSAPAYLLRANILFHSAWLVSCDGVRLNEIHVMPIS